MVNRNKLGKSFQVRIQLISSGLFDFNLLFLTHRIFLKALKNSYDLEFEHTQMLWQTLKLFLSRFLCFQL